ncbi:MAG: hypothetical protein N4Q18_10395 [Lactobacillus crispatus]|uniref:hypothetical protein n=1 Tax=Lactobacillus crispatus TaxID=47770 RepID=UPI000DFF5B3C|nr:hypothetical protein [Lactobacillus crispatus]STX18323.1 Uncharacterised protein [Lactobacillus acidophilus]MCT7802082.1 hypothetical protein [Lactobacillus crispatus]MCT7807600.1 hypothetical protein [Lactobacillus crispatus]MCT7815730.1 hypothetical protein [Lactobacillus crispatus]
MTWIRTLKQKLFADNCNENTGISFLEQDKNGNFSIDEECNDEPYNPCLLSDYDFMKIFSRILLSNKLKIVGLGGMTLSHKVTYEKNGFDSNELIKTLALIQDLTEITIQENETKERASISKNGVIRLNGINKTLKKDLMTIFN